MPRVHGAPAAHSPRPFEPAVLPESPRMPPSPAAIRRRTAGFSLAEPMAICTYITVRTSADNVKHRRKLRLAHKGGSLEPNFKSPARVTATTLPEGSLEQTAFVIGRKLTTAGTR